VGLQIKNGKDWHGIHSRCWEETGCHGRKFAVNLDRRRDEAKGASVIELLGRGKITFKSVVRGDLRQGRVVS